MEQTGGIVSKPPPVLTHARLLEILDYDRTTGVFVWKIRLGGPVKVGSVAGNNITVRKTTASQRGCSYRQIRINGANYYAHVLARFYVTGHWPLDLVTHIDQNGLNNKYCNLRDATHEQNNQSHYKARRNNQSGLLGVVTRKHGYDASIKVDKKQIYLGTFQTAEIAHQEYLSAKRIFHQFATVDEPTR